MHQILLCIYRVRCCASNTVVTYILLEIESTGQMMHNTIETAKTASVAIIESVTGSRFSLCKMEATATQGQGMSWSMQGCSSGGSEN